MKLAKVFCASILAVFMNISVVWASEVTPTQTVIASEPTSVASNDAELNAVFGESVAQNPDEVLAMSTAEMKETEGAFWAQVGWWFFWLLRTSGAWIHIGEGLTTGQW